MSSGRAALCDCWALPARKCPGRSRCRWPPASRASVTWKHKLLGRKAILPQGPWGRGKVPPAWLMRLTAWPLSRVRPCGGPKRPGAWTSPAGSACPRSRAAPPDRFLRVPGAQVAGSDRRCQVATIEPGLRAAPPRGGGAVRASRGDPPGTFPHRPCSAGRIALGISASFQFLPTSGGNQEAEGVQVTLLGCRDFPETKKRTDNLPLFRVPEGKRRTFGLHLGATEDKWNRSRF